MSLSLQKPRRSPCCAWRNWQVKRASPTGCLMWSREAVRCAGAALTSHPHIAKVSFTGSTATGKQIARAAADTLTGVTLELGGKNPAIVLKDADPAWVIEGLMDRRFLNQGQVCAASSRIYIEAPLFDTLVSGFEQAVKSLSVGPACRRRRSSTRWSRARTAIKCRPSSTRQNRAMRS